MARYLIRPKILPDESLYSHLLRSANENYTSAERMAHRLGISHPHLLKPQNHNRLNIDEIKINYHQYLHVDADIIDKKLSRPPSIGCEDTVLWHGLDLKRNLIRRSPRHCPLCQNQAPGLIRDQWYLEPYQICGYHQCPMRHSSVSVLQFSLTLQNDTMCEVAKNIDIIMRHHKVGFLNQRTIQRLIFRLPTITEPTRRLVNPTAHNSSQIQHELFKKEH